jgi:hypothetical protein
MSYTLDKSDTIIAVCGNWDACARDNGGQHILGRDIIGRKLDQFISGDVMHMFVRTMIMSARTLRRVIHRPYRADSPAFRRFMEMTLTPGADGEIEIAHRELYREPAGRSYLPRAGAGAGMAFVKRCSLCDRVQSQGVWSGFDEALAAGRLRGGEQGLRVFHGVCPDCLARRAAAP